MSTGRHLSTDVTQALAYGRAELVHNQYRKVLDELVPESAAAASESRMKLRQLLREARVRAGDICVAKGQVFLQVGLGLRWRAARGISWSLCRGARVPCGLLTAHDWSMQDAAVCFYWAGKSPNRQNAMLLGVQPSTDSEGVWQNETSS